MKTVGDKCLWGRLLVWCCAALLLGCSPEYNWRQVAVADGRVVALFPDKPATERRDLPFEDQMQPFEMTQARVGDDLFVVGYAPWGQEQRADAEWQARFGHEVLLSLYRNFGVSPPETLPSMGEPFEVRGGPDQSLRVRGQIWLTPYGLVEGLMLVSGDGRQADEQATVFFDALVKGVGAKSS